MLLLTCSGTESESESEDFRFFGILTTKIKIFENYPNIFKNLKLTVREK